ncbi:hypothetical protein ACUWC2_29000, partial [Klebsiella pneumoniae]|uniref:hypothetical protein n=1 Tax=Klebsiella pneumoniae TaxID=573 RepID=UPI0040558D73
DRDQCEQRRSLQNQRTTPTESMEGWRAAEEREPEEGPATTLDDRVEDECEIKQFQERLKNVQERSISNEAWEELC